MSDLRTAAKVIELECAVRDLLERVKELETRLEDLPYEPLDIPPRPNVPGW